MLPIVRYRQTQDSSVAQTFIDLLPDVSTVFAVVHAAKSITDIDHLWILRIEFNIMDGAIRF